MTVNQVDNIKTLKKINTDKIKNNFNQFQQEHKLIRHKILNITFKSGN